MFETIETEVRERAGGDPILDLLLKEDLEVPECVIKKKITVGEREKKTTNKMAYSPCKKHTLIKKKKKIFTFLLEN